MNIAQRVFRTGRASTIPIFSILSALAAGVALLCVATPAAADPPYVPQFPFSASFLGDTVQGPADTPGKEYSTHHPGAFGVGDEDHFHALDPEQVLNWDGIGGTYDGVDYSLSRAGPPIDDTIDREVDALANRTDAYYGTVIADLSHLLFSVDDDGAIYYEKRISGVGGVWAPPPVVDAPGPPEDVDGLEVWGIEPPPLAPPYPPFIGDANRYSLEDFGPLGIPDPLGVSVWDYAAGVSTPLWLATEIAFAVSVAAGLPPGELNEQQINLDGMMTFTGEEIDPLTGAVIPVDDLMFTIDPIGPAAAPLFDGGEIFVARRTGGIGGPIGASFLFHGGHLWDTAFPVAATFGLASENVNALESVASAVPEPASVVLAALALLGLTGLTRRR